MTAIGKGRGPDNMGECSNHVVSSCETFIRVHINDTLIKKFLKIVEKQKGMNKDIVDYVVNALNDYMKQ